MIKYLSTLFLCRVTFSQNRIIDGHQKLLRDVQSELETKNCTKTVDECEDLKYEEESQLRLIRWIES